MTTPEHAVAVAGLPVGGVRFGWGTIVTEAKPKNMFELRWRDWQEEPTIVRERRQIGFIAAADLG